MAPSIPPQMSKRQRKWYTFGQSAGIRWANEQYEAQLLEFRNQRWKLESLEQQKIFNEREIEVLNRQAAELKRDLQFANDRIEQLMNSVVIIRDKK